MHRVNYCKGQENRGKGFQLHWGTSRAEVAAAQIHPGKMATLCTETSYGLSNLKANDNKELIFVKLTDSAFRAIDEYNRNKVSGKRTFIATIYTLGGLVAAAEGPIKYGTARLNIHNVVMKSTNSWTPAGAARGVRGGGCRQQAEKGELT